MKRLLLIFTIGLFTENLFPQETCIIKKEYDDIFYIKKQKYEDREFLLKRIKNIDTSSCFANLVNNNKQYINYLQTHFSDNSNSEKLNAITDSIELQQVFIKLLKNDTTFNKVMCELTKKISDKSAYVPDTVSMSELLNIAVKYFLITNINNEGYYLGKVCTGINGLKKTEKERHPQIEAFCFATIFNNYRGGKYNMYNEFVEGIKELYKINFGIERQERLLRAQGAMYMFMRNNKKLRELLLFEYENKKEYLPFVLITEP